MTLKRGLFLAALLTLGIQMSASAQTSAVEVGAQAPPAAAIPAEQPVPASVPPATTEITPAPASVPPEVPAAATAQPPATAPATAEVTPATPQAPPPIAPGPTPVPPAPAPEAGTAQVQPPATASAQTVLAKDFILKQEELGYGVSLVSKAAKIRIPFESNPILIENKDEIKKIAGRLFSEVKDLPENLNAMAINLMSYKKEDKEQDFGLIALELKDVARADAETFKGLIKTSMMNYFKDETFFIADKFPLIVIVAHNYPEGRKEDIKWAFDLAQKKFEK
jgi:hypothetical protein